MIGITLVVLGIITLPLGLASHWAKSHLLDTASFTAAIAPLSGDPAIQDRVADQAATAVLERIDFTSLANQELPVALPEWLVSGVREQASVLGERIKQRIAPAVHAAARRATSTDVFAAAWESAISSSHERTLKVLRGDSSTVTLSEEGTLAIDVGSIVSAVREDMEQRGVRFAPMIPDVEAQVVLLQGQELSFVRGWVVFVDATGNWLTGASAILLIGGLICSIRLLAPTAIAVSMVLAASVALLRMINGLFAQWFADIEQVNRLADQLYRNLLGGLEDQLAAIALVAAMVAVVARLFPVTTRTPGEHSGLMQFKPSIPRLFQAVGLGAVLALVLLFCLVGSLTLIGLLILFLLALVALRVLNRFTGYRSTTREIGR